MPIAIISDSHDDLLMISRAVECINREGASHLLHAGDITSAETFEIFRFLKCPFTGIFGNNDFEHLLLDRQSEGNVHTQPHLTRIEERDVAIVHEPDMVRALADSGRFDLVVYGHTHRADATMIGRSLVLNPGKLARLHRGQSTLALVDLPSLTYRFITLDQSSR